MFWFFHFSNILGLLAEKRLSPSKKNLHEKNFRFRDFWFKIRLVTFWIDSDQKKIFDQIFWLCHFFHYLGPFGRKMTESEVKSFKRGYKIFSTRKFSKNLYFWPFLVEKMLDKNFWSKIFFWSESIQNGPKRILKRKSRFRKFFPIMTRDVESDSESESESPESLVLEWNRNRNRNHFRLVRWNRNRNRYHFEISEELFLLKIFSGAHRL